MHKKVFGLIGPDGAGKTSTFNILGGVMEATAGDAKILGLPARDARNNVQFDQIQPEEPTLENVFTILLRQKGSVPKSLPFPRVKGIDPRA